jgi:hypothetical protein
MLPSSGEFYAYLKLKSKTAKGSVLGSYEVVHADALGFDTLSMRWGGDFFTTGWEKEPRTATGQSP